MSTPDQKTDPLQPVLADAEAELSRRLHDACEAEASGLATKTSEEIRSYLTARLHEISSALEVFDST